MFFCCIGDEDYVPVEQLLLTFNANSSPEMCINIGLLPDNVTEIRESFLVLASSSDPSVDIIENQILVSILDDDSEFSAAVMMVMDPVAIVVSANAN